MNNEHAERLHQIASRHMRAHHTFEQEEADAMHAAARELAVMSRLRFQPLSADNLPPLRERVLLRGYANNGDRWTIVAWRADRGGCSWEWRTGEDEEDWNGACFWAFIEDTENPNPPAPASVP